MNKRKISEHLAKVINEWLLTLPFSLRIEVAPKVIVTGGSLATLLMSDKVNDYDVYFKDPAVAKRVAEYYSKFFKGGFKEVLLEGDRVFLKVNSNGFAKREPMEGDGAYVPVCATSNAITLSNKIQLIMRFCGEPSVIHENFDFIHCTNYYDHNSGTVVTNPDALESLITMELKYQGSKYPLASIIRTRKFISRGWTINAGQYLKMALQLQEINLRDPYVLRDQLMGVDLLLFEAFIQEMNKNILHESWSTQEIMSLINRFF